MANNKRQIKGNIKKLQAIKTWQLAILIILASFVAATFLRLNNVGMVERRKAVLAADEAGDREALQDRLYDLQRYVARHMNTDTGGFYLEQTYYRDSEAIREAAARQGRSDSNVHAQAAAVCDPQYAAYSQAYLHCFLNELGKHPSASELVSEIELPPEPYHHSFAAPLWSPDFAGFSVLIVLVLVALLMIRLVLLVALRMTLKMYYRGE